MSFLISYDWNGKSHKRIVPQEEASTVKTSITSEEFKNKTQKGHGVQLDNVTAIYYILHCYW